jgi:hypothetical protein
MVRDDRVLTIPNPHSGDSGIGLLAAILREAGVTRAAWEDAWGLLSRRHLNSSRCTVTGPAGRVAG